MAHEVINDKNKVEGWWANGSHLPLMSLKNCDTALGVVVNYEYGVQTGAYEPSLLAGELHILRSESYKQGVERSVKLVLCHDHLTEG